MARRRRPTATGTATSARPSLAASLGRWEDRPLEEKVALRNALRRRRWQVVARRKQLPPQKPCFIWALVSGRGFGKTRAGAEWVAGKARQHAGVRIALVAQRFADGRDTMVEGESGLLSVLWPEDLRGSSVETAWNRSLGELHLANGSQFKIYSSERPQQLRGPQHHFAWGDEPFSWDDANDSQGTDSGTTFSNILFGLRLKVDDEGPRLMLTGTPRPVALLTSEEDEAPGLLYRENVAIVTGHTDENLDNLSDTYRSEVVDPLRGTRLGRQELAAEILSDVQGALWKQEWLNENRVETVMVDWQEPPVLGVDPSDGSANGAEHAYTLVGKGMDHRLYVVESEGLRVTPTAFARECVMVAHRHGAEIVVEKNHGGQWLVDVFRAAMRDLGMTVGLRTVVASQNKRTRAEPVAALYEPRELGDEVIPGKVHHVGYHPQLEQQMTTFTGSAGEVSPDRLDSLVWALHGYTKQRHGPPLPDHLNRAVPYTDTEEREYDFVEQVRTGYPSDGAVPWS